jgi:hypothetical protein
MASNPAFAARLPFSGLVGSFLNWLDDDARPTPQAPARKAPAASPTRKPTPELTLLEWDGTDAGAADTRSPVAALDRQRRRMRDRYIAARFFGTASSAADLTRVDETIKGARLLFEDGHPDLALELLELALQEAPVEPAFWLARLELLFVTRRAEAFTACAREFREVDRAQAHWPEVERLGRSLAPDEPLFGGGAGKRAHDHYGPWPDLPNWIRAPWDLTAELKAADFHRAVLGMGPRAA